MGVDYQYTMRDSRGVEEFYLETKPPFERLISDSFQKQEFLKLSRCSSGSSSSVDSLLSCPETDIPPSYHQTCVAALRDRSESNSLMLGMIPDRNGGKHCCGKDISISAETSDVAFSSESVGDSYTTEVSYSGELVSIAAKELVPFTVRPRLWSPAEVASAPAPEYISQPAVDNSERIGLDVLPAPVLEEGSHFFGDQQQYEETPLLSARSVQCEDVLVPFTPSNINKTNFDYKPTQRKRARIDQQVYWDSFEEEEDDVVGVHECRMHTCNACDGDYGDVVYKNRLCSNDTLSAIHISEKRPEACSDITSSGTTTDDSGSSSARCISSFFFSETPESVTQLPLPRSVCSPPYRFSVESPFVIPDELWERRNEGIKRSLPEDAYLDDKHAVVQFPGALLMEPPGCGPILRDMSSETATERETGCLKDKEKGVDEGETTKNDRSIGVNDLEDRTTEGSDTNRKNRDIALSADNRSKEVPSLEFFEETANSCDILFRGSSVVSNVSSSGKGTISKCDTSANCKNNVISGLHNCLASRNKTPEYGATDTVSTSAGSSARSSLIFISPGTLSSPCVCSATPVAQASTSSHMRTPKFSEAYNQQYQQYYHTVARPCHLTPDFDTAQMQNSHRKAPRKLLYDIFLYSCLHGQEKSPNACPLSRRFIQCSEDVGYRSHPAEDAKDGDVDSVNGVEQSGITRTDAEEANNVYGATAKRLRIENYQDIAPHYDSNCTITTKGTKPLPQDTVSFSPEFRGFYSSSHDAFSNPQNINQTVSQADIPRMFHEYTTSLEPELFSVPPNVHSRGVELYASTPSFSTRSLLSREHLWLGDESDDKCASLSSVPHEDAPCSSSNDRLHDVLLHHISQQSEDAVSPLVEDRQPSEKTRDSRRVERVPTPVPLNPLALDTSKSARSQHPSMPFFSSLPTEDAQRSCSCGSVSRDQFAGDSSTLPPRSHIAKLSEKSLSSNTYEQRAFENAQVEISQPFQKILVVPELNEKHSTSGTALTSDTFHPVTDPEEHDNFHLLRLENGRKDDHDQPVCLKDISCAENRSHSSYGSFEEQVKRDGNSGPKSLSPTFIRSSWPTSNASNSGSSGCDAAGPCGPMSYSPMSSLPSTISMETPAPYIMPAPASLAPPPSPPVNQSGTIQVSPTRRVRHPLLGMELPLPLPSARESSTFGMSGPSGSSHAASDCSSYPFFHPMSLLTSSMTGPNAEPALNSLSAEYRKLLKDIPRKSREAFTPSDLAAFRTCNPYYSSNCFVLMQNGYDIRLGEVGRAALKKEISRRLKGDSELRERCVSVVCRLKNANVLQLLQMAEIAGCLGLGLKISSSYWREYTRKQRPSGGAGATGPTSTTEPGTAPHASSAEKPTELRSPSEDSISHPCLSDSGVLNYKADEEATPTTLRHPVNMVVSPSPENSYCYSQGLDKMTTDNNSVLSAKVRNKHKVGIKLNVPLSSTQPSGPSSSAVYQSQSDKPEVLHATPSSQLCSYPTPAEKQSASPPSPALEECLVPGQFTLSNGKGDEIFHSSAVESINGADNVKSHTLYSCEDAKSPLQSTGPSAIVSLTTEFSRLRKSNSDDAFHIESGDHHLHFNESEPQQSEGFKVFRRRSWRARQRKRRSSSQVYYNPEHFSSRECNCSTEPSMENCCGFGNEQVCCPPQPANQFSHPASVPLRAQQILLPPLPLPVASTENESASHSDQPCSSESNEARTELPPGELLENHEAHSYYLPEKQAYNLNPHTHYLSLPSTSPNSHSSTQSIISSPVLAASELRPHWVHHQRLSPTAPTSQTSRNCLRPPVDILETNSHSIEAGFPDWRHVDSSVSEALNAHDQPETPFDVLSVAPPVPGASNKCTVHSRSSSNSSDTGNSGSNSSSSSQYVDPPYTAFAHHKHPLEEPTVSGEPLLHAPNVSRNPSVTSYSSCSSPVPPFAPNCGVCSLGPETPRHCCSLPLLRPTRNSTALPSASGPLLRSSYVCHVPVSETRLSERFADSQYSQHSSSASSSSSSDLLPSYPFCMKPFEGHSREAMPVFSSLSMPRSLSPRLSKPGCSSASGTCAMGAPSFGIDDPSQETNHDSETQCSNRQASYKRESPMLDYRLIPFPAANPTPSSLIFNLPDVSGNCNRLLSPTADCCQSSHVSALLQPPISSVCLSPCSTDVRPKLDPVCSTHPMYASTLSGNYSSSLSSTGFYNDKAFQTVNNERPNLGFVDVEINGSYKDHSTANTIFHDDNGETSTNAAFASTVLPRHPSLSSLKAAAAGDRPGETTEHERSDNFSEAAYGTFQISNANNKLVSDNYHRSSDTFVRDEGWFGRPHSIVSYASESPALHKPLSDADTSKPTMCGGGSYFPSMSAQGYDASSLPYSATALFPPSETPFW